MSTDANKDPSSVPDKTHEASRDSTPQEPSYYDVPMLKPPVWTWEVPVYFFLGGLSAGAYILARVAERFGGKRYHEVTRAGTVIAALAALPCPLLLIADLGDPKRFHHMLRIWKPASPMNLGTWTLIGYSSVLALATLREWLRETEHSASFGAIEHAEGSFLDESVAALSDAAGVPLALLLAGYTGVLLSSTANPIWSKNPWLGALFSASAMSTGSAAIGLALEVGDASQEAREVMHQVEVSARVAEAITLTGYLEAAGDLAAPLTRGEWAPYLWGGTVGAGIIAPTILERLPLGGKARRWAKIASCILTLVGGLATRWAILHAGHTSANNPDAARQASRADKS